MPCSPHVQSGSGASCHLDVRHDASTTSRGRQVRARLATGRSSRSGAVAVAREGPRSPRHDRLGGDIGGRDRRASRPSCSRATAAAREQPAAGSRSGRRGGSVSGCDLTGHGQASTGSISMMRLGCPMSIGHLWSVSVLPLAPGRSSRRLSTGRSSCVAEVDAAVGADFHGQDRPAGRVEHRDRTAGRRRRAPRRARPGAGCPPSQHAPKSRSPSRPAKPASVAERGAGDADRAREVDLGRASRRRPVPVRVGTALVRSPRVVVASPHELISSLHSGPFSVSQRSPVSGSNVNPNELRMPKAKMRLRLPSIIGFVPGTEPSGFMRRILPRRFAGEVLRVRSRYAPSPTIA